MHYWKYTHIFILWYMIERKKEIEWTKEIPITSNVVGVFFSIIMHILLRITYVLHHIVSTYKNTYWFLLHLRISMSIKPIVSVIMPVYNTEKYVSYAIESILSQTYDDFEFIIIDDGSTDDSWNIIQEYAVKDKRIRAYRNIDNMKICKTLNKWINLAKGTYIARMDADDIAMKSRLEIQIREIGDDDMKVVWSNVLVINDAWTNIWERKYPISWEETIDICSPCAHPTVMFSKKLIEHNGGYDHAWNYVEDYDLWIRLFHAGASYSNIQQNLLQYRMNNDSTKSMNTKIILKKTIRLKYFYRKKWHLKISVKWFFRLCWEMFLLVLPAKYINALFIYLSFQKDV